MAPDIGRPATVRIWRDSRGTIHVRDITGPAGTVTRATLAARNPSRVTDLDCRIEEWGEAERTRMMGHPLEPATGDALRLGGPPTSTTDDSDLAIPHGDIQWGDGPQTDHIATLADLDAVLDRLDTAARAKDDPALAIIGLGGTRYVTIGLGTTASLVCVEDSGTWESWCSRGDPHDYSHGDTDDIDEVEYWLGNQPSYYPPWALIPMDIARQVVRDIFTTGERPDTIRWDDML